MELVRLVEGPLITTRLTDLGETSAQTSIRVMRIIRKIREDGDEREMLMFGYVLQRGHAWGTPELVKGRKFRLAIRA